MSSKAQLQDYIKRLKKTIEEKDQRIDFLIRINKDQKFHIDLLQGNLKRKYWFRNMWRKLFPERSDR